MGLVSEQSVYNLNERTVELEVIPACRAYGLGLIPWSPLARGLLAGALEPTKVGRRADEDVRKDSTKYRARLEGYEQLCRQLGEQPADVALAWCSTSRPSPLRCRPPYYGSAQWLDTEPGVDPTCRDTQKLDELFPGPGGAAPEAYAW